MIKTVRSASHPHWLRYGVAVVLTAAVLGLKLALSQFLRTDTPFLLFLASVMVSGWYGGLGPGLLATALAALASDYYFMPPFHALSLARLDLVQVTLFAVEGAVVSVISAGLASARRRAGQSEAEARQLERRILEIADEEQRRIGHDLHDGLGQHLTGIALIVRRLEHHLQASSSPDANDAKMLSDLTKTAVEWTHDLSRSLSPPVLESPRGGLAEALRELASNAETIFKIRCTFEQIGTSLPATDLPSSVHLYRIAQEAISNAVRHGGAKHVAIELRGTSDALAVRVVDDGAGIEQPNPNGDGETAVEGMGLRIMRYRARMIGATVDVNRRGGGGGTEVTCVFSGQTTQR
jgi:signal transduction histidine kinase